jgi:hypothetical protein
VRDHAAAWIDEALAPLLEQESCRSVLAAAGIERPESLASALASRIPPGRPIAEAPGGAALLLPDALPKLDGKGLDLMKSTGLLPFEVAMTGEWARAMAARHAGPVPRDPLLRLTRSARLEGVARLAGITAIVGGSNLDPQTMGVSLLALDRDLAGLPRELIEQSPDAASAPAVARGMLRVLLADGVRWAVFHFLRAGPEGVSEALERPAVGPEELLRPGARRPVWRNRPEGCRLGPRGAAALLTGREDPPWIADLSADSFSVGESGGALGWLGFDDEAGARRAATEISAAGHRVEVRGSVVILELGRATESP